MNNACTTLNNLFKIDFSKLPESTLQHLDNTEIIRHLRQAVEEKTKGLDWQSVRQEFIQQLEPLLDIRLQAILVDTWQTLEQVKTAIKIQREGGNKNTVIKLAAHNICSTHTPSLVINYHDQEFIIQLFVAIDLDIEDLTLKLHNGKITKILTGFAKGKGIIQYQNITLRESEILQFSLASNVQSKALPPPVVSNPKENKQPAYAGIEDDKVIAKAKWAPLSNTLQFIIGIAIALVAVYIFWQF